MPTFTPPVVSGPGPVLPDATGLQYLLFRHYPPVMRGQNVYKMPDGTYLLDQQPQRLTNPDPSNHTDDAVTAAIVYYGGHSYAVDATEAAALTAAGFGAYLT